MIRVKLLIRIRLFWLFCFNRAGQNIICSL